MWSRLLAVLIVVAVALPTASISLEPGPMALAQYGPEMGVPLDPTVSGDITFWHFWGSPVRRTAIRRIVAMCSEALPAIRVEEVFKPWGEIWAANSAAVAAGEGMPDVIVEDRPQLPHIAAQGIEQNLQPYIDRDGLDPARFWPFTWEQTLYEGDSYGLPFETDVRVLFYNKTLFEQAGLDPEAPPATWDQLWEYAAALDVVNADGSYERMGFFPLFGNVGIDAWAQTAGHTWVQEGRPVVDDPVVADTLAWLKTWVERYGGYDAVQDFRSLFGPAPNDAFMTGMVAMIVDISSYNSILNFYRPQVTLEDGSTVSVEWGVALIPYLTQPSSVSGGFALSIPTGASQPDAAWEFVKCATSPAAQVSWARDTYAIPSDIEAANDPLLMVDPEWQFFVAAMEHSTAGAFVPAYSSWRDQLQQRLEAVWSGQLTIENALAEAQAAIDDVIAQTP